MERDIGLSVAQAGSSTAMGPCQFPASVFIWSKTFWASEPPTDLPEDCPCAKPHTLNTTITTTASTKRRDFMSSFSLRSLLLLCFGPVLFAGVLRCDSNSLTGDTPLSLCPLQIEVGVDRLVVHHERPSL